MTRALFVLALISSPALAQAPPAPKPIVVPFTLLPSRHMMIETKVNGKGPYRLIFDTGAPLNLVNNKLAKETKIAKKAGKGGGLGGGFGLFGGVSEAEISTLEIGGLTVEKLPVAVMDHPTVKAISDAFVDEYGPIDGIVGFPLFGRYSTTVDYQKKELTFSPSTYKPGDLLQDLMGSMMKSVDRKNEPRIVGAAGVWGFSAKGASDDKSGIVVDTITPEGPAAKGGLKVGDRLLTLDGRWTDTVSDLFLVASLIKPGRTVTAVVVRDGKEQSLTITPVKGY